MRREAIINCSIKHQVLGIRPNTSFKITNFTDLLAWQEGHKLVLLVYEITKVFPTEEKFGLSDQMRRAAVSVTSNIAEGFSRNGEKEKIQFYKTACGSLTEVQNQFIIAKDVSYLSEEKYAEIWDQGILAQKLLNGLIKAVKAGKLRCA